MAFTAVAIAAGVSAVGTVVNAASTRKSAKEQASQVAESARQAAMQAAESARGNALAQQAAVDRANAEATARRNVEAAALDVSTPDVEIAAAADPKEAARRRTVRAQFSLDEQPTGSIRL